MCTLAAGPDFPCAFFLKSSAKRPFPPLQDCENLRIHAATCPVQRGFAPRQCPHMLPACVPRLRSSAGLRTRHCRHHQPRHSFPALLSDTPSWHPLPGASLFCPLAPALLCVLRLLVRQRVRSIIGCHKLPQAYLGIALGGGKALVAQKFLH